MSKFLQTLNRLLPDPSPSIVIEVGDGSIVGVRRTGKTVLAHTTEQLPAISTELLNSDLYQDEFQDLLIRLLGNLAPLPNSHVAILLPDAGTRLTVFEFETIPQKIQNLHALIEQRMQNSLPFDVKTTRIAFEVQNGTKPYKVLVCAIPATMIHKCEQAFEKVGLRPGYVGLSSAVALNLVSGTGMTVLLKFSSRMLTMAAIQSDTVCLIRQIALGAEFGSDTDAGLQEILADLLPTLTYIEDTLSEPATNLLVCGPGEMLESILQILPDRIGIPVEPLLAGNTSAGIQGYLHAAP